MKTLAERQKEFVDFFNEMDSWQDRFNYLIEIGSELPEMLGHLKTLETLIPFCQSRTYFHVSNLNGKIRIEGWSSSSIVSGLIAMLKSVFEGGSTTELEDLTIDLMVETKLVENMTQQRKATLQAMILRIESIC